MTRGQFDLTDIVFLSAVPGDGPSLQRARVDNTDPRHFESAGIHRYAARLVEELLAVRYAHNQCIDLAEHCVDAA